MTVSYKNPLFVPIRVDAAWSDGGDTAPPTADFSRLKGTVPPLGENFSQAQPWLGDTARPLPGDAYCLAPGIHLHWTLPAGLRRGETVYVLDTEAFNELVQQGVPCPLVQALQQKAAGTSEMTLAQLTNLLKSLPPNPSAPPLGESAFQLQAGLASYPGLIAPAAEAVDAYSYAPPLAWDAVFLQIYGSLITRAAVRMKLPPVPNRWLVVREREGAPAKAWVIESDRLTAPQNGMPAPGAGPAAVPAAFAVPPSSMTSDQAFQFLGLKTPVQQWSENPGASALKPLTAAGHGIPDFAAFYPNCQGVFGFHDPEAKQDQAYAYTVIGWYSDAADDPASPAYGVLPWSQAASLQERLSNLGWQLTGASGPANPDGSAYAGQISVLGSACPLAQDARLSGVQVALGNTLGEALAARLADGAAAQSLPLGLVPETVLGAAEAGVLRRALEPDGPAVIENALHEQAFQPLSRHSLWEAAPPVTAAGLAPDGPPQAAIPPAALGQALNALNAAQEQFDRTQAYLRSQRRALFTDWCRALHLATDDSSEQTTLPALTTNAGAFVNQTAFAVDAAGMGDQGPAAMLAYLAAKSLYLSHAAAQAALPNTGPALSLKRSPAPRFFRPNDPVVLMSEAFGGSTLPQPGASSGPLDCLLLAAAAAAPPFLPSGWNSGPAGTWLSGLLVYLQTQSIPKAQPSWRPISLAWEASYRAYADEKKSGGSGLPSYSPGFIADDFKLDASGIELLRRKPGAPRYGARAGYSGRVPLGPGAMTTLRERILRLAGLDPKNPPSSLKASDIPKSLDAAADLLAGAYNNPPATLAQSLDGFHDRLLMLRRIPQVSLFDPGFSQSLWNKTGDDSSWSASAQSFYLESGTQAAASPQQSDRFNPIRAGKCELTTLQLVDAFGQTRTWRLEVGNFISARTLPDATAVEGDGAPAFILPPRLSQPARLAFRWIAADGTDAGECGDRPPVDPICGWLALNRMDETVLVFDAAGALAGWVPAGGGAFVAAPGTAAAVADPYLQQVVSLLETPSSDFFSDIATALLTIEPNSHRHCARTVLESRPLALARASLRLEVDGMPAPHQGYAALAAAQFSGGKPALDPACPVAGGASPFPARESCGFPQVQFPVRLGDVAMDADGLAAFWTLQPKDHGAWTLPAAYSLPGAVTEDGEEPTVPLSCDPLAPQVQVLMLFDPRAAVHATSGILPCAPLSLSAEVYADAVRKMEFLFSVGPVLTPADSVRMPIPAEAHGPWSCISKDEGDLTIVTQGTPAAKGAPGFTGKCDDRVHLTHEPPVIRDGWLRVGAAAGDRTDGMVGGNG